MPMPPPPSSLSAIHVIATFGACAPSRRQASAWPLLRRCGSKVPPSSVMRHTRHRYVRFVLPPGKQVAFDYDPTYAHEANV